MIALIQRVTRASVTVEGEVTGEIGQGLLVLLGVERDDDEQKANRLCERVLGYRIFSDAEGKMNLNVQQAGEACWWCRNLRWPPILNAVCDRASQEAPRRIALKRCMNTLLSAAANRK